MSVTICLLLYNEANPTGLFTTHQEYTNILYCNEATCKANTLLQEVFTLLISYCSIDATIAKRHLQ